MVVTNGRVGSLFLYQTNHIAGDLRNCRYNTCGEVRYDSNIAYMQARGSPGMDKWSEKQPGEPLSSSK